MEYSIAWSHFHDSVQKFKKESLPTSGVPMRTARMCPRDSTEARQSTHFWSLPESSIDILSQQKNFRYIYLIQYYNMGMQRITSGLHGDSCFLIFSLFSRFFSIFLNTLICSLMFPEYILL